MKTAFFKKKLTLNKTTVANLEKTDPAVLAGVKAGGQVSLNAYALSCATCSRLNIVCITDKKNLE